MTIEHDYWLTTPRLSVSRGWGVEFAEARVRILGDEEADRTREAMTKRLMGPARSTDTYAPKVDTFRGVASLSVRLPAADADHSIIREIGRRYEILIFLTEAFALKRGAIHRLLGISTAQQHPSTDLVLPLVRRRWRYSDKFSTRSIRPPALVQGLPITPRTKMRFARLGLSDLAPLIVRAPPNATLKRVHEALRWLDQSVIDKDPSAAVVKTCIGFECLFGFDKSEPLRQCISDRGAFLLARAAGERSTVARLLRTFYDHRSAIVHGDSKKVKWSEQSQQQVDRMLLTSAVCVASLSSTHPTVDKLRAFFDGLKWSAAPEIPTSPVSASLLKRLYAEAPTERLGASQQGISRH